MTIKCGGSGEIPVIDYMGICPGCEDCRCPTCEGSGTRVLIKTPYPEYDKRQWPCPRCNGTGCKPDTASEWELAANALTAMKECDQ